MKRTFLGVMLAAMVLLSFNACSKSNSDSDAHEVEVLVNASIEGGLTKGLKLSYEVTDFKGHKESGNLNECFDSTNCQFYNVYSSKTVGDSLMVRFWAEKTYDQISATGPWNLVCDVTARFKDKPNLKDNYNANETESNPISLTGDPNFLNLITDNVNRTFGNNYILVVKVTEEGFEVNTIDIGDK